MDTTKLNKITDEKTAKLKAEHYCAYQERSQQEVRNKLYEWCKYPNMIETIISQLISDNFLNEERFAKSYAQGKFRQKGWGKIKIKQELKLKRVPDILIKKALQGIDGDEYLLMLQKVLIKKLSTVTERDGFKRRYELTQYALSRGYEGDLITEVLKDVYIK